MTTQQPDPRQPARQGSAAPAPGSQPSEPRYRRARGVIWTLALLCGGLVLVLLFFATIGVIDFSEAPVLGFTALGMGLFFLVTMWTSSRSGERRLADRERRGF